MRIGNRVIAVFVISVASFALASLAEDKAAFSCPAEEISSLRLLSSIPDCSDNPQVCAEACSEAKLGECVAAAYAFESRNDEKAAQALYKRACLLGAANACTNFGAGIWSGANTDHDLSCAHRMFRAACTAGEHYACGMMARLAFEAAELDSEFADLRAQLESACSSVGGFSCRVLARYLETDKLGPFERSDIQRLLARACAQGDPEACGNPATASETFD